MLGGVYAPNALGLSDQDNITAAGGAVKIVPVDLLAVQPCADIWVVTHRDMWGVAKVSAFRKLLIVAFRDHRLDFLL